jgi:hypothetical protein
MKTRTIVPQAILIPFLGASCLFASGARADNGGACPVEVLGSKSHIDSTGAAYGEATVRVKRPFHELALATDPLNATRCLKYFKQAYLFEPASGMPIDLKAGSDYSGLYYMEFEGEMLMAGSSFKESFEIKAQSTAEGRFIEYRLHESIESSFWSGLYRHTQKGGVELSEGTLRISPDPAQPGSYIVNTTKRASLNMDIPFSSSAIQNRITSLNFRRMDENLKEMVCCAAGGN